MFYSSILIKLSVFLPISSQILRKIQPENGNFHRNGYFSRYFLKNLPEPRNFYTSAICDKFLVNMVVMMRITTSIQKDDKVQQPPCQYSPLDDDDDNDHDNYDEY